MLKYRSSFTIAKAVVFALVLREVRGRFSKNRLGAFWFIFEPIAHILVVMVMFGVIRNRTVPGVDFAIFLVHGIVPFIMFKNIALKGMESVNSNRGLFAYRQVKPFSMVVARTIVEASLMLCVYAVILFCLWWVMGYDSLIHQPLEWLAVLLTGVVLSFGSALIFCVIIDAMPESSALIRIAYMPLYFLSGVMFPLWLMPQGFIEFLVWNPYLHLIELLREYSIDHYPTIPQASFKYVLAWALGTLFVGMFLYRVRRYKLVAI